jgi:hypothetical protein
MFRKNYSLRVIKKEKIVDSIRTHLLRVFLPHLRTVISDKEAWRAYLRVSYGKEKDSHGQWQTFYNDGWYENVEELQKAWEAFIEE